LLGLQAEYVDDPRALEAFAESQNRVRAMALVHERVYQSSDLARVDLAAYIRDLVERLFVALGADPAVTLDIDVEPVSLPMDTAIPCGLLISELVSNSIKHAFPAGRSGLVRVTLRQDDRIVLTIADDGVGLPEGLDHRHTESLGLQLVTILAQQLGATIDVDRSAGTRFTIAFRDES
jgi:two-component sensor histidine kinase